LFNECDTPNRQKRQKMNYLHKLYEFTTIEEGEKNLDEAIELREKMGGVLFYEILNQDVHEIRLKLESIRTDEREKNINESNNS